ncbi:MAG: transcriptional repressor LexA [Cyanobacteria bacterium P01_F01_bin.42]
MEPLTKVQQELYDWLVDYIQVHQHAPSIRQMMHAMELRSPAPVQSRLDHLRRKGYIDWQDGQARTMRILHFEEADESQVPILGEIAAGGLIEPFADESEVLSFQDCLSTPDCFALRVNGDSMIDEHIAEGDIVIMRPVLDARRVKNGTIVAAHVPGQGTTLKRFFRKGAQVTLEAANEKYDPLQIPAGQVEVQGLLVGVWRDYL